MASFWLNSYAIPFPFSPFFFLFQLTQACSSSSRPHLTRQEVAVVRLMRAQLVTTSRQHPLSWTVNSNGVPPNLTTTAKYYHSTQMLASHEAEKPADLLQWGWLLPRKASLCSSPYTLMILPFLPHQPSPPPNSRSSAYMPAFK